MDPRLASGAAASSSAPKETPPHRLRFAMVCASNQNRSMEAHALLQKEGFDVASYGVGGHVKLPGSSAKEPNVYAFGTPYQHMYDDLMRKDPELYARNGLLRMLERNVQVKQAPQRWQECKEPFDVVVTFEERVMEQVLEDMHSRPTPSMRPALVVNLDVKDSHEEAAMAAPQALELCTLLEQASCAQGSGGSHSAAGGQGQPNGCGALDAEEGPSWCDIERVLEVFEQRTGRRAVYSIAFY